MKSMKSMIPHLHSLARARFLIGEKLNHKNGIKQDRKPSTSPTSATSEGGEPAQKQQDI